MRCPGQDMRYWKDDAVFEVPCPKCDAAVEFFKDENSGRCPKCGHRFRNPKVSFDCAKWCSFAEECLGVAPEAGAPANPGEGALASRLIRAIKEESEANQPYVAHTLRVFQYARELLCKVGGDPRIVLGAALLLEVGAEQPRDLPPPVPDKRSGEKGVAKAKQILQGIGLEEAVVDCICHIIGSYQRGDDLQTIESRIVRDAHTLAKLAAEDAGSYGDRWEDVVRSRLKTEAGKDRARGMLSAEEGSCE